jgi:hypothetical protein
MHIRYALAVNVIVCVYSIAQALGEIRRLVAARFAYRSMSSYYFSLFLDQASAKRNVHADQSEHLLGDFVSFSCSAAGLGVPPDVGIVGCRVAQQSLGVELWPGCVQQEDHQRNVAVLPWVHRACCKLSHLHG